MITLFYGEDIAKSHTDYLGEKSKYEEKITLDGATLTLTDLLQAFSGSGLFGETAPIFIEELFSKRKASKELDELTKTIASEKTATIFLWESKELTTKQLGNFKGATLKQYKTPTIVFAFTDALIPHNGKKLITLFHELLQDEDANFALFMLMRQVRILLTLSGDGEPSISEAKRLAPWQKGKMQKQAKTFTTEQLIALHSKLYKLELGQKTGGLSLTLEQELDFLLASL